MMLRLLLSDFGKSLIIWTGLACMFNLNASQITSIDGLHTVDIKSQKIQIEQKDQVSYVRDLPDNEIKCVVIPGTTHAKPDGSIELISNAFNVDNSCFIKYVFPVHGSSFDSAVYFKAYENCKLIIFSMTLQKHKLWFGIHSDDPMLGHFDFQKIMASILHSKIEVITVKVANPKRGTGFPPETASLSMLIKDRLLKEDDLLNLDSVLEEAFILAYRLDHPGSPSMQYVRKYGIESPYAAALFYAIRYQAKMKKQNIKDEKIARVALEWQFKSY